MLPLLLRIASEVTGVSVEEIKSKSRRPRIVEARFLSIYALKELGRMSYTDIGRELNRDHSSVLLGCRKVEKMIEREDADGLKVKEDLAEVERMHRIVWHQANTERAVAIGQEHSQNL